MSSRDSLRKELLQKKSYRIMRYSIIVLAIFMVIWTLMNNDRGASTESTGEFVSIEIVCHDLIENPDALKDEALREYIPEDGYIVRSIDYQIRPGKTTVFDITDQVCKDNDIQIEYEYTPAYGGYYIKGINYLYEFAAGSDSGWMYKVDDVTPSYGPDKMKLQGGEKIVWYYTLRYE